MNINHDKNQYITSGQAAQMIGVTRNTILFWGKEGLVSSKKVGLQNLRYSVEDLRKMVSIQN
jgi:DNA-binding transcriptional MerR regulator